MGVELESGSLFKVKLGRSDVLFNQRRLKLENKLFLTIPMNLYYTIPK